MNRKWSEEEDSFLIKYRKKKDLKVIAANLNRSPAGVRKRATKLSLPPLFLRKWSEEEDMYLKANWSLFETKELARHLNRSASSVATRGHTLRLKNRLKKWTIEEEKILRADWQRVKTTEISKRLGRTTDAIQCKARELQLVSRKLWTITEEKYLTENWHKLRNAELAKHLNHPLKAIKAKASELQLGAREKTGSLLNCATCGTEIYRPKYRVESTGLHFCSRPCMHELLRSGKFTRKRPQGITPNKPERTLDSLLQQHFPDEYAFNGDFSQGVMLGGLTPDFVNVNGKKQVIELFGDYWHDKKKNIPWKATEFGRQAIFSQLGFKSLIIWEHELKNQDALLEKIGEFNQK